MACATFITVWTLRLFFGDALRTRDFYSGNYIVMLCTMAVVQYVGNSLMIAASSALKSEESIWRSWRQNYLWTSITYLAGASAAGIIARFIGNVGFLAFSATIPIIAIVYFTYWTYMKNVEGAASQAEQARRHVEELNRHIAEQERISKALRETEEHFRNAFDYAAIGTVSNVASRLCDEAKTGQILISPRVLMDVEDAVAVEPVGEFELKGIRRPLAAYNVLAPKIAN